MQMSKNVNNDVSKDSPIEDSVTGSMRFKLLMINIKSLN